MITLCFSLHMNRHRPWLLERMASQLDHYDDRPRTIVADYAPDKDLGGRLAALCEKKGAVYLPVEDSGLFGPGIGRNRAAETADTPLLFFCDADFFMPRDTFSRLRRLAEINNWDRRLDLMVNFPAEHLNQHASAQFLAQPNSRDKSVFLERMHQESLFAADESCQFFAPYSNVFLCHRRGFDLSGGYNERFRGHGSEDFEFLLRFAMVMRQFPLPEKPLDDTGGPLTNAFFIHRKYAGFRRLLEAMSFPAEVNGFRAFHLYHPENPREPWVAGKDLRRAAFKREAGKYIGDRNGLLEADWLRRGRRFLALSGQHSHLDIFLSLRMAGIGLATLTERHGEVTDTVREKLDRGEVDGVVAFGDDLDSTECFRKAFAIAKAAGGECIRIVQGPLPWFWRFESALEPQRDLRTRPIDMPVDAITMAAEHGKYLKRIRASLQTPGSYKNTRSKYAHHPFGTFSKVCLLAEGAGRDGGEGTHLASLAKSVSPLFPRVRFLVRGGETPEASFHAENVRFYDASDDFCALMDVSDAVVTLDPDYASAAFLFEKPVYGFDGCSDFMVAGIQGADDLRRICAAIEKGDRLEMDTAERDSHLARALIARGGLLAVPSHNGDNGAHGAEKSRSLAVYRFEFGTTRLAFSRGAVTTPLNANSYITARLGLASTERRNPLHKGRLDDFRAKCVRIGGFALRDPVGFGKKVWKDYIIKLLLE